MVHRILNSIRLAMWFGPDRARGYSWLGLVLIFPIAALIYRNSVRHGADFAAFWAAGRLAWSDPAKSYDLASLGEVLASVGFHWCPFVNPPPFLLLIQPLGLLSYQVALPVFLLVTAALYVWSARRLGPASAALLYMSCLVNLFFAQNGFLTAALLIGGCRLLDRRPYLAGALLGALVIKPHLAILLPVALLFAGRWRPIIGAAASSLGLLLMGLVAYGPHTYAAFFAALAPQQAHLFQPTIQRWMVTPFMVAEAFGAPVWAANVIQGASFVGAAMIVAIAWRGRQPTEAKAAVLCAAAPFATPYLFSYDLTFLFLPIAWLAAQGVRTSPRPWERIIIAFAIFAPLSAIFARFSHAININLFANLLLLLAVVRRWIEPEPGRSQVGELPPSVGVDLLQSPDSALPLRDDGLVLSEK